eukprot:TRINITY_DN89970_c0_g1_i1.p1 TRINITY_DN89970_c0_g1~~TRINITY_DN89970_c0_g1_i1.p1  ORF type:complete len:342 (+),score=28.11 TRINITY_DN89970_c0_g1_i1:45-1028(+)
MYDADVGLLFVPASLWADTLKRTNFTSDSNAYMVRVLQHAAEAFDFLNDTKSATDAMHMAQNIRAAMNKHLWKEDHYVTMMLRNGSHRDWVDYDSNLLAVGIGIPDTPEKNMKILQRVDSGVCTHVKPTYISEKFYGPEDCFSHNDGDSVVAMGRIAWADALARGVTGDAKTFREKILAPIMHDVNKYTWLFERFICDPKRGVFGEPGHSEYFIEYGEVLTMMLREVKYGIRVGFSTIEVLPMAAAFDQPFNGFVYNIGDTMVEYQLGRVCMKFNKRVLGKKRFTLGPVTPDRDFIVAGQTIKSSSSGLLEFQALLTGNVLCAVATK